MPRLDRLLLVHIGEDVVLNDDAFAVAPEEPVQAVAGADTDRVVPVYCGGRRVRGSTSWPLT